MLASIARREMRSSSRTSDSVSSPTFTWRSGMPGRRCSPFSILSPQAPQSMPSTRSLSELAASAAMASPRFFRRDTAYAPSSNYKVKCMARENLSIGDLAKATNTKVVTIRYYEKNGTLPAPDRNDGNNTEKGSRGKGGDG